MSCHKIKGCPPDTHNLHCGYPDCAKGRADSKREPATEAFHAYLDGWWPLWKQSEGTARYYDLKRTFVAGYNAHPNRKRESI